jgi:hypothetical protein
LIAQITRDFGGIRIETLNWPIVVMEFPESRVSESDFHQALAYIEHLMREAVAKGEKSYQVTDITRVQELATATQRKYAAEFVKRNSTLSQQASLGTASVTPSSILRGIMTAIFWISPPPTPAVFFATRNEAYLHAIGVLERGGARLPQRLVDLRGRLQANDKGMRRPGRRPSVPPL